MQAIMLKAKLDSLQLKYGQLEEHCATQRDELELLHAVRRDLQDLNMQQVKEITALEQKIASQNGII